MSTEANDVLKWSYADGTNFIQVLTTALQDNIAMNMPFLFWWFLISVQFNDESFFLIDDSVSQTVQHVYYEKTLWRKEKTNNRPTDKREQVTSGTKQSLSFQILRLFKKFKQ